MPPPAATGEDRWDRYRQCPRCNFSFCLACSSTWHGPHTACPLSATDAILSEYLRWPEGSEGRRRIEARRGKAVMDKMLAQWKEDQDNKAWITSNTSACTGCGVRVEKRSASPMANLYSSAYSLQSRLQSHDMPAVPGALLLSLRRESQLFLAAYAHMILAS